ncbi:MAG: extracellular solute-binding protein [Ruminococcaceae bacterium]|nr:extracellular solute-binding protein [Oscillospiraceae bacterium]
MRKHQGKRLISLVLSVMMVAGSLSTAAVFAAEKDDSVTAQTTLQTLSDSFKTLSYAEYIEKYADVGRGSSDVVINAADYDADETTADVEVVNDYLGRNGQSLQISDSGHVTWTVDVPEEGMYEIIIEYCSTSDKTNSIERTLSINGKVPFSEARYLLMKKTWVHKYADNGRFETDFNGNELRPKTESKPEWLTYSFMDPNGYYANPFEFYFEKGENTITLTSIREPVVIGSLTISPYEDKITYDEYISGKTEAVGAEPIYIPAELPTKTSDYTVYPIYDRKSAITEPQDSAKIRLNTIGAEKWKTAGQWVEYVFEVKEAGLYQIVTRYRQNELNGMYTSRRIYIDGVVPFEEANHAKFNYDPSWQVAPLNNGADEFQFYFEPGKHTLRLEVTMGEMGTIVRDVAAVVESINNDYLEILKLTGPTPDSYRDYGFGRVLPDVVEDLVVQALKLQDIVDYLEGMDGLKSTNSTTLEQSANLLIKMGTDEEEIAKNLTGLKDEVSTLGNWITTVTSQFLEIDYILVQPASAELPRAEANFFQAIWYEFKQFLASFFTDYNNLGASEKDLNTDYAAAPVEIWYSGGRDQAQIIRNLIDNNFVPETGIAAAMKLVDGGALLPSVLAGIGPDVSLAGGGGIDWAIRNAIIALNPEAYEDKPDDSEKQKAINAERREVFSNIYDEIYPRFTQAAWDSITLYGNIYGVPSSQSWPMLFYRTDILADLGLEIPKTWDDLLAMVPVLQFNNMDIGLPQDYAIYLYQNGGNYWTDNGMRVNIDSKKALDAFETMCDMFTQYTLPISFDFANRFKTGEMPIAITDYTAYNSLILFAHEIAGLWEFGPIPGTVQADGTINNVAISGAGTISILSGVSDVDAAWKFICWYTDKYFQVEFSNEMVALLGPSAKNATANIEALEEIPWTAKEYQALLSQMQNLVAITPYPGDFFTGRYTNFAFLAAYNEHKDPTEELLGAINDINKEISRKRKEFDLETLELGQTLASKRLDQAADLISELDDAAKNSAQITAATNAILSKDIAEIRSAVSGLDTSSEEMARLASYLTDAANALESYLE